jgi:hypothetical protein
MPLLVPLEHTRVLEEQKVEGTCSPAGPKPSEEEEAWHRTQGKRAWKGRAPEEALLPEGALLQKGAGRGCESLDLQTDEGTAGSWGRPVGKGLLQVWHQQEAPP